MFWTIFITDNQAHRKRLTDFAAINCKFFGDDACDLAGHALCLSAMRRALILMLAIWAMGASAHARDSLGIFGQWGAFRDPAMPRCYAIAEPARTSAGRASWRAFLSVGTWPKRGVRGQIHVRLSRAKAPASKLYLSIAERRFALVAGSTDGWATDARMDAAIVAAMRSAETLSIEGTGANGRAFADIYALKGAATAMDAAALGCAR